MIEVKKEPVSAKPHFLGKLQDTLLRNVLGTMEISVHAGAHFYLGNYLPLTFDSAMSPCYVPHPAQVRTSLCRTH